MHQGISNLNVSDQNIFVFSTAVWHDQKHFSEIHIWPVSFRKTWSNLLENIIPLPMMPQKILQRSTTAVFC